MAGLAFVALQYLAYTGTIQVNYDRLLIIAKQLAERLAKGWLLPALMANVPFAGSFAVGFALGL